MKHQLMNWGRRSVLILSGLMLFAVTAALLLATWLPAIVSARGE